MCVCVCACVRVCVCAYVRVCMCVCVFVSGIANCTTDFKSCVKENFLGMSYAEHFSVKRSVVSDFIL